MFIILNGTKEEHLDMLDGGIIQRLLEEKWKTFARVINIFNPIKKLNRELSFLLFRQQNQFLKRLLILFIHLFFLSISVYLRPITENLANKAELESNGIIEKSNDDNTEDGDMDATEIIRYGSECATLLCVLSYVIFQQGDEIKNQGFSAFIKQLV